MYALELLPHASFRLNNPGDAESPPFYTGPETYSRRVFDRAGGPTILYIEDEISDFELVRKALNETLTPPRLVWFSDAGEALFVCSSTLVPPDLVLLDINLPRIGGLQILERLKELPVFSKTKVVILTTSTSPLHRTQAMSLGADDYITKPFGYVGYDTVAERILSHL